MQDQDAVHAKFENEAGCLTRFYWMFLGNAFLLMSFGALIDKHPKFPAAYDAACLLVAASLVYVRYLDVRQFKGQTGDGQPATMDHWRRYALFLGLGSAGAWLAIRLLIPLFAK